MDKRSLVLYLSGLVAAGAAFGLAASCSDQPRIKCTAGHGPFNVLYSNVSNADCLPRFTDDIRTGGKIDVPRTIEQVGVEAYNYPLGDGTNLDPNRGKLGMESLELAGEVAARDGTNGADATHKPFTIGDWFGSEPDGNNFCEVKEPTVTEQNFAFVPEKTLPDGGVESEAIPAGYFKYEWSKVRFYNTPAAPGTQLVAELTYTRADGLPDGGLGAPCSTTMHAVGLWPAVSCVAEVDDNNDGMTDRTVIDDTLCFAEPANGRPTGSGISPDLKTTCNHDIGLCVLVGDPPAWK